MATKRKTLSIDVRRLVLHEAGYKCANPTCRGVLTLDIHHLEPVSKGGPDLPENLLPLCPNCHALHHAGHIPFESLRSWKMLLLSLNEGFDSRSIDLLLALDKMNGVMVWGEGVLHCAGLIASDLVKVTEHTKPNSGFFFGEPDKYFLELTDKGKLLVDAWKRGDQSAAVRLSSTSNSAFERDAPKAARPSI